MKWSIRQTYCELCGSDVWLLTRGRTTHFEADEWAGAVAYLRHLLRREGVLW